MIKTVVADGKKETEMLRLMRRRASETGAEIEAAVREIMEEVRSRGFEAVREYSLRFDGAEPREISASEIDTAYATCSPELVGAMELAAKNIREYQSKLLVKTKEWNPAKGVRLGCIVRGIDRLGIYVPGGIAAYPSSVLMNAVPARVAGVREIIMVTPPTKYLSSAVLAAARIAGVDKIIAVGGAQAIAALTYGAGFIPRVDKLVGPGNAYVTAAKRLAYGQLDIDMVAGPSEILIIADRTAKPAFIAADMLSQAEHDKMASAILVTDDKNIAEETSRELERQAEILPRNDIIRESLDNFGAIILCQNLARAVEIANEVAPEHLEIMTESLGDLLPGIRNAGAVFLGSYSPEPLGDYMAGPSHVLPTSGTARFFSPLSVDSFLKKMSVIEYDREALKEVAAGISMFAKAEELTAHANSIDIRFQEEKEIIRG